MFNFVLRITAWLLFILALGIGSASAEWQPISKLKLTTTPQITLNNLEGDPVSLKQFKGRVILVNFWASWCEPCREEFQDLIYLQDKHTPKKLVVLAINLAESKARVQTFLKNNIINEDALQILLDRNSLTYKEWKARGIPVSFLVNKKGQVEKYWLGQINVDDPNFISTLDGELFKR